VATGSQSFVGSAAAAGLLMQRGRCNSGRVACGAAAKGGWIEYRETRYSGLLEAKHQQKPKPLRGHNLLESKQ